MSYFPVPKNLNENAVLTRDAAPDYVLPTFAAFPVPTANEAGAKLEIQDTGDRYRWSGTTWIKELTLADVTETSNRGGVGVAVFIQDQTTGLLDLPFLDERSIPTLTADVVAEDRVINVLAGHGGVVGDTLELATATGEPRFMQSDIIAVTATTLTIDSPATKPFPIADTLILISNREMAVDGSVNTVSYSIAPLPNQIGDMVRLLVTITDTSDMDFETFGGIPALTNGIVIRVNNGDGTYRNIANFKNNGEIANYAYDIEYFGNKANDVRGLHSRLTWGGQGKHGVVVRLDGDLGESLEILIQDDLSGLASMRWLAQGSEVQS